MGAPKKRSGNEPIGPKPAWGPSRLQLPTWAPSAWRLPAASAWPAPGEWQIHPPESSWAMHWWRGTSPPGASSLKFNRDDCGEVCSLKFFWGGPPSGSPRVNMVLIVGICFVVVRDVGGVGCWGGSPSPPRFSPQVCAVRAQAGAHRRWGDLPVVFSRVEVGGAKETMMMMMMMVMMLLMMMMMMALLGHWGSKRAPRGQEAPPDCPKRAHCKPAPLSLPAKALAEVPLVGTAARSGHRCFGSGSSEDRHARLRVDVCVCLRSSMGARDRRARVRAIHNFRELGDSQGHERRMDGVLREGTRLAQHGTAQPHKELGE